VDAKFQSKYPDDVGILRYVFAGIETNVKLPVKALPLLSPLMIAVPPDLLSW
jgi:hypothetical protein